MTKAARLKHLAIALLLLLPAWTPTARSGARRETEPSDAADARIALRAGTRNQHWRYSHRLDIDCDGVSDEVFTSTDRSKFYVAVVLGPISRKSRFSVVAFERSGTTQASLCGSFESLTPEPLSSVVDDLGEEPDGYLPSAKCRGLVLVTGECDPFHLFWNRKSNALDWWRI